MYSADGEKLQRSFASETENHIKITTYINQYIYEESTTLSGGPISPLAVSLINFEEGRIRVITPTSQGNGLDALIVDGNMDLPNGMRGAYDYFIMDYQQNVRMIVTEETHIASNTCTMETDRATLEESIFGQAGVDNEVATTRYPTPGGWDNRTEQVSRLGANCGYNVGPNTLQKVMAGDQISTTVQYYYEEYASGNNTNFVSTLLSSLVSAISGGNAAGNLVKGNAAQIGNQLSGVNGFINAVQPHGSDPYHKIPEAYLTVIFFDERFNFIEAADGGVAQEQVDKLPGSSGATLTLASIKAPKNGYAYIYISNQSNTDVFFDDLQVGITQGNIAEENHYYAYGLKIATLSSKKLGDVYEGSLKNNFLYQGAYSEFDDDIGWNDFALRNYDAQIGRWVQQDPYQEFASPYVGLGGDPVNLVDPDGGSVADGVLSAVGRVVVTTIGGAIIGTVVGVLSGDDDFTGTLIGAGIGLAAGLGSLIQQITVSMGIQTVNFATTVINTSIKSEQAGMQISGANIVRGGSQNFGSNVFNNDWQTHGPNAGDNNAEIGPDDSEYCPGCIVWGWRAYRAWRAARKIRELTRTKVEVPPTPAETQKLIEEKVKEALEKARLEKLEREKIEKEKAEKAEKANSTERNWKDDKILSKGEIEKMKKAGWKDSDKGKSGSKYDLYKDKNGNIYQKRKGGQEAGEATGDNINDF